MPKDIRDYLLDTERFEWKLHHLIILRELPDQYTLYARNPDNTTDMVVRHHWPSKEEGQRSVFNKAGKVAEGQLIKAVTIDYPPFTYRYKNESLQGQNAVFGGSEVKQRPCVFGLFP